ncbi:MAG: TlpA family protein disulfide reductase [Saprospiraceae bacterium]|nr:TlpA family protein disulfide reductase [Saprospiraceae bacterium]
MSKQMLLTLFYSLVANALYSTPYFYLKIEPPSPQDDLTVWTAECALKNAEKEWRIYKIELRKNTNDASFTLDVEEPKFVTFTYAGESFEIFVEPTDDIKISFKNGQIGQTIRFEGKGAENNTILRSFHSRFCTKVPSTYKTQFLSPALDKVTEVRAIASDAATFFSFASADKEAGLTFLTEVKPKIHKKLYSQLWKELNYAYDTQLYAYFLIKKMDKDEFRLTTQIFFPFKGFNYTDYELNETFVFRNALKTFVHYQATQFQNHDDPYTLFETIEKKLSSYNRFWLEKELLIEVLDKTNNLSFGRQHIEQFRKNCTFPELIKEVDDAYNQFLDVTERAEAPDLELVTTEHTPLYLKDFRGKVVYVSFWASWCQPCIANFTKYAEVRNRLHTEGVILLNVNIDEQPDKFRSALARLNIKGLNVQPMDIDATKRLYNLYTIPSYFIIDKKGKFAHLSDQEGRDVIAEFKKLQRE